MKAPNVGPVRGRPRDPGLDVLVLEATRALLREQGFAATTVRAISRRSGVHPPAIYLRWPSRIALIEDAAFSQLAEIVVRPTGDLRRDLRRLFAAFDRSLDRPEVRAATPGLFAEYQHDPPPDARLQHFSVQPQFRAIVAAASDAIDPHVDADEVFDIAQGAILARNLVPSLAVRRRRVDGLVDMVMRSLVPSDSTRTPH